MVKVVYQKRSQNVGEMEDVRQRRAVLQDGRALPYAGKLTDDRTAQLAQKSNNTGLPDNLKHGIESLSGMSMDNVKVHYNSSKPAQLNAHAYAQGTDIHLASGQEKHLPHEAWHVVQQAQGRVRPTMQMKGNTPINNDKWLEHEADVMGGRALQLRQSENTGWETNTLAQSYLGDLSITYPGAPVVQRLVGAALPIVGHDAVLPNVAANRGAAASKIAKFINLRARETAAAGVGVAAQHENISALGAHNAGNLYVRSDYTNNAGQASRLEVWAEMTGVGGGYIKRVRIIENAVTIMDRVMNDPNATALNLALQVNAGAGAGHRYGSVHTMDAGDTNSLEFRNTADRDADNLTKVIGEGARFAWLSERLSTRAVGNTSTGIFQVSIKIPQMGTFTMNPTFADLWGSWASAFGRSYMKDKNVAKNLLKQRLTARLRVARDNDVAGVGALASGATAAGQVTSLLSRSGNLMLMPIVVANVSGADIITDLRMTWTADH